ncbi:hypothetical protein DFQ28_007648 [Apophysomyces sp. BC1034]|nr:hypothetical protein DFQ29_008286 [Apophysomyces sp. BC1021]KAG0174615.1 hypothetical protein DFQ30_003603 [Apophysomyces sp. BC1015]KAG0186533.1 hypothetical protein DFQ28_007648 [Apophysomyces sp. BC1034]
MKLDLITFFSLTLLAITVAADNMLVKRTDKLPYATLPNTNCVTPDICKNIKAPYNCRCNNDLTQCINDERRFCWGSQTMNRTVQAPQECNGQYEGTPTCLTDGTQVLCVTERNMYCYGTYQQGGAFTLGTIPNQGQLPATTTGSPTTAGSTNNGFTPTNASTTPTPTSSAVTEYPMWTLLMALLFVAVQSL